jgi:hypothetical protein
VLLRLVIRDNMSGVEQPSAGVVSQELELLTLYGEVTSPGQEFTTAPRHWAARPLSAVLVGVGILH